ncbi:MAG: hypothetical protein JF599_04355 [Verrucomicrobia bacterium]|nr:hypothetical protein [Verrucomicrobiota bacterium]
MSASPRKQIVTLAIGVLILSSLVILRLPLPLPLRLVVAASDLIAAVIVFAVIRQQKPD